MYKTIDSKSVYGSRMIAALLFGIGWLWAPPAISIAINSAMAARPRMASTLFFGVGTVIWIFWGLIWLKKLKKTTELFCWFTSIIYHGAIMGYLFLRDLVQSPYARYGRSDNWGALAFIPVWWFFAITLSITGAVLCLRHHKRAATHDPGQH